MESKPKTYDYIIAGTGAAGLSLLCHILSKDNLKDKNILLIDRDLKDKNDRTWCFWDTEKSPFESCLKHTWEKLYFHSPHCSRLLSIKPYTYKMLDSLSFYKYCFNLIEDKANINFIQDEIQHLDQEQGLVTGVKDSYQATYIFNSILFKNAARLPEKHYLVQHFKGIFIKTEVPVFNPEEATLMDFRIPQHNDCRFVYVLPVNQTEALIEYTGFSNEALSPEYYDRELHAYIQEYLNVDNYRVTHEEFGIIPMTDAPFDKGSKKLINIGTAGGATKASTGYTFSFIQKQCARIAGNLADSRHPLFRSSKQLDKYRFYDSIFLRVLSEKRIPAVSVFNAMFSKLPAKVILSFLDEESSLSDDIRLMYTLDKAVFISAALRNFFSPVKLVSR